MSKLLILSILFSFNVSALSIKADQLVLTNDNASEFGFSVVNEQKELSKICTKITLNKDYKKAKQIGFFLKIESSQGQPVFSGWLSAHEIFKNESKNYNFCYQSYDVIKEIMVIYGYKANMLVTTYLEISSELIAP